MPGRHRRKMLGTVSKEAHPLLESLRKTQPMSLRKLKAGSLKECPRNSAGESLTFWVLCPILKIFSQIHMYRHNPESFREQPGAHTCRNQEPNEDRCQDDAHPKVRPSVYQSRYSNDLDPDEALHISIN